MAEISQGEIQTVTMDHHGLVAAICHDLKIAERMDSRLSPDPQRKVSPRIGECKTKCVSSSWPTTCNHTK